MNNDRKYLLLLPLCLLCIALSPAKIKAQIEGHERDEKLSEKALATSRGRTNRIKEELAQLKDNQWAGEYYYGDGLGVNVNLIIAPKSGFVFTLVWLLGAL